MQTTNSLTINSLMCAFAAVAMAAGTPSALAATLTAVPMQGGMVMPMVAYRAEAGQLQVMMPAEVPQLTPLMVSHPGDSFDTADPWFDSLDPSRQGLSFSRRYGFVMDTLTDPLPPNTSIWIRKTAGPAELGFYRYSGSVPEAWEPLFGTAGAPDAIPWNGMMFHPGVTAPPGTNLITATFELFLASIETGEELPGSNSGPLLFNWTNVPDGRPSLEIGIRLVVAWSASASGYVLESTDAVAPAVWTTVTNAPVMIEGQPAVVLEPDAVTKLFRMRQSP
jgi:hypothetical protein